MSDNTYRAAVSASNGSLTIQRLSRTPLSSNDIRFKVLACGICGSDVASVMRGEFVEDGQVLGHEVAFEVLEAGSALTDKFAPGDKVAVLSSRSCGSCPYCLRDQPYLCDRSRELSLGYGIPGGLAEELVFPNADPDADLILLPADIDPKDALWVEPLSVALHALERSGASHSSGDVLIIGAGSLGLSLSAAAIARGIVPFVAELREERVGAARKLGVHIDDGSETRQFATIIDTAGSMKAIEAHLPRLQDGGVLTLVGLGNESFGPPPRGIDVRASFAFSREDWILAVQYISEGKVSLGDYVNVIAPLEQVEGVVRSLVTDPHIIKAAVIPTVSKW